MKFVPMWLGFFVALIIIAGIVLASAISLVLLVPVLRLI